MARGSKDAYTEKQKRQAAHSQQSEQEAGRSKQDAERIAWASVNKQDGGGKKLTKDKRGDSKRTSIARSYFSSSAAKCRRGSSPSAGKPAVECPVIRATRWNSR